MAIKAESADGVIHEFPDGTDRSVIDGAMKKYATEKSDAAQPAPEQRSGVGDFLKSIPRGLMSGAAGAASASGQAAAIEMGQSPESIPSGPESTALLEKNVTGDLPKPQGAPGKFGAAVGEVLGNPATYLGPGSMLLKTGAGAASALASEGAGQLLPEDSPLQAPVRMAAGVMAGGGASTAAAERNLSKLAAQLPAREATKAAASQVYKSLETAGTRISPPGMDELVRHIKTDLNQGGWRSWTGAPGAPIFQTVEELATSGGTIQGIDAVRQVLRRFKPDPSNAAAADRAIDAIDDFMMHVDPKYVVSGNPQQDAQALKYAQGLWATHKQLETIEEGSIRGQRRAGVSGSGANRINTARQEINKILNSDKKSRGMSEEAKAKMEEIVLGTWLTNKTRGMSKFAPTGPVSAGATVAADLMGGTGAAAAVASGGFLSKYLGEYLTDKQIRELEQLIKSESPMGAPVAKAIAPAVAEQKAIPAASVLRAAATTPLAPDSP